MSPRPPFSKDAHNSSLLTSCFFPFQTNSMMYESSSHKICGGIEKISVLYLNLDRRKMFSTRTLPMNENFRGFQYDPLDLIFASSFVNTICAVSLFPIHKPNAKTLSLVHLQSKGLSCLFLHLPINRPSVLPMFILAPVASSYNLSCLKTSVIDELLETMICVPSAH